MRTAFVDKLIQRMDRLEPQEVQHLMLDLLREKGFLEKVFQALQEGIILLDAGGCVTYINRAACEFFNLEADAVMGQQLAKGVHGLDWKELLKASPFRYLAAVGIFTFRPIWWKKLPASMAMINCQRHCQKQEQLLVN